MPPQRTAVFGTRPYVGTAFDVVSLAALLGYGLALGGAGGLGLAVWRAGERTSPVAGLLVLAVAVPVVAVGLRFGSLLPLPLGRLLVRTNAAFVPFGAAWAAVGYRVWVVGHEPHPGSRTPPPPR